MTFHLLLVLFALGFFVLATLGVWGRINFTAAGLFCWLLASTGWVG